MSEITEKRRTEVRALAHLAGEELDGAVTGLSNIHLSVSDRIFKLVGLGLGSSQAPVKAIHDAIAQGVYAAVGGSASFAGRIAQKGLDLDLPAPPSETAWGSGIIAAVQGLRGDTLEADEPALTGPLTLRRWGTPIPTDADSLAAAFPDPSPRLVVFVHGLMETEFGWRLGGRPAYGDRLATDLGCTPLYVRFNSGRHISENARELIALLRDVVDNWPVDVTEIGFVGHSMGGLIARSACHLAAQEKDFWVGHVRHIVCLGSPHFGAPLERIVHYASAGLSKLPETAPIGRLLRRRSNGIRDLRLGSLVDEDWSGRDKDALRAAACTEVPLLDGATHCFVSATLTRSPRHPLGLLLGDGLVLNSSATGRSRARRIAFEDQYGFHVGPGNHFTLLNNDMIYERLLEWLATPPAVLNAQLAIGS